MGEMIWSTVQVKTPPGWQNPETGPEVEPADTFAAGVTLDAYLGERDVHVCDDGGLLWSWNGEANYGLNANDVEWSLNWLEEWRVPYVADCEAKYEWPGEIRIFDGSEVRFGQAAGEGVVLDRAMYLSIAETHQLDVLRWSAVVDYFEQFDFDIHGFDVSYLPAFPPPDPDDALTFDECEDAGVDGTLREVG